MTLNFIFEKVTEDDAAPSVNQLVELYAARARDAGWKPTVLMIDESQSLHDVHFETLFDLQKGLESTGFKVTVIPVGSHE